MLFNYLLILNTLTQRVLLYIMSVWSSYARDMHPKSWPFFEGIIGRYCIAKVRVIKKDFGLSFYIKNAHFQLGERK